MIVEGENQLRKDHTSFLGTKVSYINQYICLKGPDADHTWGTVKIECPIHTTGGASLGEFFSEAELPPGRPILSELFILQAEGH